MHEMALVRNIVDIVVDSCAGQNVGKVRAVHLTIGEMSDVVDAYIPGLFRFLARGTVAEEADVVIRRTPLMVRCTECGEVFRIDVRDDATWECPRCNARQKYRLFSGNEFRIDSIEIQAPAARAS